MAENGHYSFVQPKVTSSNSPKQDFQVNSLKRMGLFDQLTALKMDIFRRLHEFKKVLYPKPAPQ